MSYLIYDCEILRCIPPKGVYISGEDPYRYGNGFAYCQGWGDFAGMGISCLAYIFGGFAKVFDWQNLADRNEFLSAAATASQIIGFNSKAFDDKLLEANGVFISTTYDLLEEVRLAAYGSSSWEDTPKGCSYSLDAIARANGAAKNGSGSLAPQLWQQGKYEEVLDYCLNDVIITHKLLELGLQGLLIDPNTANRLQISSL